MTEERVVSIQSLALRRRKMATVLLPANYHEGAARYPVTYLLHGYASDRRAWLTETGLRDELERRRVIVVLPESGRRWFINDFEGNLYQDYLIQELIPSVDGAFRTIPERSARAVGGFSMGGAAAIMLALQRPDIFLAAASHSGAFGAAHRIGDPYSEERLRSPILMPTQVTHERVWGPPGSATRMMYDPFRLAENVPVNLRPALYLDVGLDDFERIVAMNREFHRTLERLNFTHEYHECPGSHGWKFVASRIPHALNFLGALLPGPSTPTPQAEAGRALCAH